MWSVSSVVVCRNWKSRSNKLKQCQTTDEFSGFMNNSYKHIMHSLEKYLPCLSELMKLSHKYNFSCKKKICLFFWITEIITIMRKVFMELFFKWTHHISVNSKLCEEKPALHCSSSRGGSCEEEESSWSNSHTETACQCFSLEINILES